MEKRAKENIASLKKTARISTVRRVGGLRKGVGAKKNFLSSSNGSCALACLLESFQVVLCRSTRVLPPTDVPYFPAVVFR